MIFLLDLILMHVLILDLAIVMVLVLAELTRRKCGPTRRMEQEEEHQGTGGTADIHQGTGEGEDIHQRTEPAVPEDTRTGP